MERIKLDRANSLEKHAQAQHVKFVNGRSTSHASPPSPISTVASSSTLPDSNAHGSDTALVSTSPISTSPTLPSPSSEKSHQPNAQGHKRLSFRRSSGRSTSSGDSGSSERPAHGGTSRTSPACHETTRTNLLSAVGPCLLLKRATSGLDFPHHQSPRQKSPVRRTDPYQAPYFFPSPLSPDAAGYAQRLRIERGGSGSPDTTLAALSLTSSPLASVPSSQYGLEARRDGSSAQGSSDPVRRNSTKRPQPLPLANVRNRPLSWDSDIRHLRTKKSASSMQSVETPSTATPGKKFWRKPTKTHHAHLVALNTVANLERLPDSLTSPPTTAKQKRTWFRRRHTMSVSDLPSPATLTGELSRQSRNVGDAAVVS
ncbi:hypothetical protein BC835DRAFT_334066 [Cytidiella melzeri]|nr:hypothetical protein BC835DRAFT_334066 [Cytidiella melzeri]